MMIVPGMLVLACLYVALQAFFYFQPFIHSTAGSFYFLAVDPQLYARDIIRTSSLGVTTSFYDVLHFILGNNLTNPYFLFWPYLMVCGCIAAAVYMFAKYLSGGRIEAGIIALILLLVQKGPVNGANLTLVSADFHYQHFALPFILWSVYCLFRERYFYSALLMSAAFYFHLKTPAAVTLALLPLWLYEIYKKPKILFSLIVPVLAVVPKIIVLAKNFYVNSGFSSAEKKEYMDIVLHREGIEGSMYFNELGILNLFIFGLLTASGVWFLRYIVDEKLRRKVFLCQTGVLAALGLGTIIRIVDYFYGPLGEIVVMGYTRSTILGLLMTIAAAAVFFVMKLEDALKTSQKWKFYFLTALLFFAGLNDFYFSDFGSVFPLLLSKKSLAKFMFSLLAAGVIFYIIQAFTLRHAMAKVVGVLLIACVSYVLTKGGGMMYRSYKAQYPYFPFVPLGSFFEKDLYDAKMWAARHTPREALFLTALGAPVSEDNFCRGDFRMNSLRSVWCQNETSMYGDPKAFREWKRRQKLLRDNAARPTVTWDTMLENEKIDYVVSVKNFQWPAAYEKIYENPSYLIYKTKHD